MVIRVRKNSCCTFKYAAAPGKRKAVVAHGHAGFQRGQQTGFHLLGGDDAAAALDD